VQSSRPSLAPIADNSRWAEMASRKKKLIILNELSHSCGRVFKRLDGKLRSRQSSRQRSWRNECQSVKE
jgi:hypothetical protein